MDAADTRTANPSHIDLQNLHYRALSLSETFAVLFMVAVFKPELTLNDKAGSRNVLHLRISALPTVRPLPTQTILYPVAYEWL